MPERDRIKQFQFVFTGPGNRQVLVVLTRRGKIFICRDFSKALAKDRSAWEELVLPEE